MEVHDAIKANEYLQRIKKLQDHLKIIKDLSDDSKGYGLFIAPNDKLWNSSRLQCDFMPMKENTFLKIYVVMVSDEIDNLKKQLAAL